MQSVTHPPNDNQLECNPTLWVESKIVQNFQCFASQANKPLEFNVPLPFNCCVAKVVVCTCRAFLCKARSFPCFHLTSFSVVPYSCVQHKCLRMEFLSAFLSLMLFLFPFSSYIAFAKQANSSFHT